MVDVLDARIFDSTRYREASVDAFAKVASHLPLTNLEIAPKGVGHVECSVWGAFTAATLALNGTTPVVGQANTDSKITVDIDQQEVHRLIRAYATTYQQALDSSEKDALRIRLALNKRINDKILAAVRATTPLGTVTIGSGPVPIVATDAAIAIGVEMAFKDAAVLFDTQWGNAAMLTLNGWLDNYLFRSLAAGTTKQTVDNSINDSGMRITEGIPHRFQGVDPYNVGSFARTYTSSLDSTLIEFWIATPDVLLTGLQLEEIGMMVAMPGLVSWDSSVTTLWGYKAGPANQAVKVLFYVEGNHA